MLRNSPEESSFHLLRGESMKLHVLITVSYKQSGGHKEFVSGGKTVNSELIIRADAGKRLTGRILREWQLVPFAKQYPC